MYPNRSLTPKRYEEHPCPFYTGVNPGGNISLVILSSKGISGRWIRISSIYLYRPGLPRDCLLLPSWDPSLLSMSTKCCSETCLQALTECGVTSQHWIILLVKSFSVGIYNNYSMSPSWIWNDKITNERVARVGYNHFISNKGEWNNFFSTGVCRRFLFRPL